MDRKELLKRIADHMALLVFGLLMLWIVIALNLFGKVTLIEDVKAVRILDLVCVVGLVGYPLYRLRDLHKELKKRGVTNARRL